MSGFDCDRHISPQKARLPQWVTRRGNWLAEAREVKMRLRSLRLHTVCESARCPNIGECFASRTATFMILGDRCTRRCAFCAVETGRPLAVDPEEPARVARAAQALGLDYAVVTSVARDDLPDGGAFQFAATIRELRRLGSGIGVEVLVPDFGGSTEAIERVLEAGPDVLAHNLETVKRLTPGVRWRARYERSLALLAYTASSSPRVRLKSGLMLGLGERPPEVRDALVDLRRAGCEILTLGQYLRPTLAHLPVADYLPVEVFIEYASMARELGFVHVSAGPLVRSSYHARAGWRLAGRREK